MSTSKTGIAWTDRTWNPVRGCSRVSEGCRFCYAEGIAARFSGQGQAYEGLARFVETPEGREARWTGKVRLVPEALDEPLRWRKPRRIFVNSMSDLFHEGLSDEEIDRVFAVMALAPQHSFQVLTKRPERMRDYCSRLEGREVPVSLAITRTPWYDSPQGSPCAVGAVEDRIGAGPLPNVWIGVSVEDQATADERIPLLLQTPAAVRFVSYEPALGPVDFFGDVELRGPAAIWRTVSCGGGPSDPVEYDEECVESIDWLIAGGESGPRARPCDLSWLRSARDQCAAAGVAFFCKQLGSNPHAKTANVSGPGVSSETFNLRWKLRDRHGADPSEWPEDLRVQQFPEAR